MMNIKNILILIFFAVTVGSFACNINYTLIDSAGVEKEVSSYHNIVLKQGETYNLVVDYY